MDGWQERNGGKGAEWIVLLVALSLDGKKWAVLFYVCEFPRGESLLRKMCEVGAWVFCLWNWHWGVH
jgi:hypothetical protein